MGIFLTGALVSLVACATPRAADHNDLPPLSLAVTNNAAAVVTTADGPWLASFLGLGEGRTYRDITNAAFVLPPGADRWQPLPPPPGPGRLASTAATVGELVYLFGGYTVAKDGSEESIETVYSVDLKSGRYTPWPAMPVPVDDAVSAVYADRYVYLVSGWHDSGNVNLVQVLDTGSRRWFQATPFPGAPVFGHAGGIAGDVMVICDGVTVVATTGQREFAAEQACYRGRIDGDNPARIDWTVLPPHPGPALYRMAAVGVGGRIVFAGGSDNPYNYNGLGYDGRASAPSDRVFYFDSKENVWHSARALTRASMDHRALLPLGDDRYVIVGGMRAGQKVTRELSAFALHAPDR